MKEPDNYQGFAMRRKRDMQTDHLEEVEQRLREERPEAEPLRLDRIKTTAMARTGAGRRAGFAGRRLVAGALTISLMAAGAGGVLAEGGSTGGLTAVRAEYGSPASGTQPTTVSHKKAKKKAVKKAKKKAKARHHKVVIPRFTG